MAPKANITCAFLILLALTPCIDNLHAQVTAQDGKIYKTVKIGNHVWMSENLDVSIYRNGDTIPEVQDGSKWINLKTGAWCYYENKSENGKIYGKLYNWYAVNDPRGLAPKGWNIPSTTEWQILNNSLTGGSQKVEKPNSKNDFIGLMAGYRGGGGKFMAMSLNSYWWTSTEGGGGRSGWDGAWGRIQNLSSSELYRVSDDKSDGMSVRCIKDKSENEESTSQLLQEKGIFNSIRIGNQIWMAENLNVPLYRNGDSIRHVQELYKWSSLTEGAWCYYEDKTENGIKYGRLYNWYAIYDPRGLAPTGWHIPSDGEWQKLSDNFGSADSAGNKMKSSTGWQDFFGEETHNSSNVNGFAALPGGLCSDNGKFFGIGRYGYWWSSTEHDSNKAWFRMLSWHSKKVDKFSADKRNGYSVRCIRD